MRTLAAFFVSATIVLGLACVGDDPSGAPSSNGSSAAAADSSGTPNDPDASSSGGSDSAVVHTGGGTMAQLQITATSVPSTILPVRDGGIVMAFAYVGAEPLVLADATIACTRCAVIAKLDASLSHVVWYAYGNESIERSGMIAQSPDGRLYWALEAPYAGTATITGSAFGAPRSFTVISGDGVEGAGTGGTRLIVALDDDGSSRWIHELRQTNAGELNTLGRFGAFAASDKAVLSTFANATGELKWSNATASGSKPVSARFVISELDADTGAASIGAGLDQLGEHDEFRWAVGIAGYNGKGFAFTRSHYAAGASIDNPDGTFLSLGQLGTGDLSAVVSYAAVVPSGSSDPRAARYKDSAVASASIPTALRFGDVSLQESFGAIDSAFFVLDKAAPAVKGQLVLGGAGDDVPVQMVEISGSDEVYLVGRYRSSDMQLLGATLPSPADALSNGMYVVRAAIDPADKSITPLWARGFMGNPGGSISVESAAADLVTGDLYVTGSLGGDGTFDFGSDVLTTEHSGNKLFALRFARGL